MKEKHDSERVHRRMYVNLFSGLQNLRPKKQATVFFAA